MQREDMLAKVDAAYAARRAGDFAALQSVISEDAVFSYGGEQDLLAASPRSEPGSTMEVARELFERIEIRNLERVTAVAEGDRVAILWNTTLALPGREPFATQMFDLWEFDDAGRICRGTQFVDTAKVVAELKCV